MPEVKKATLKVTLSKEVNSCLAERPDLKVVKVPTAPKIWTFLSGELPDGEEVFDFYHAAGHLDTALAVAYGDTHPKRVPKWRKCVSPCSVVRRFKCLSNAFGSGCWPRTREWRK